MKINELPEQEIGALPEGQYHVGIKAAKPGYGKESNVAYLKLSYVVLDGENKGRYIFDLLSYSPKALWRIRSLLESLGLGHLDVPVEQDSEGKYVVIDDDDMNSVLAENLLGKDMVVVVNHVEANKEKGFAAKNEVIKYLPSAERGRWDE